MPKRPRTEYGGAGGGGAAQRRARMASMAIARKYPYSEYGRIMHRRGTEAGIARFGGTYRSASQSQRANRKAAGYYGRGEYYGKKAGRWLAERTGIPGAGVVGEFVGDKAGDWVKKNIIPSWLGGGLYEGRGRYTGPNTNQLITSSSRMPPKFSSVDDETGALVITHSEYIGDLFGNDYKVAPAADADDATRKATPVKSFQNRVYELNPGIERTFPWLSQIAQNYEEYEFGQLVFEYKSTVSDSVASDGQVGSVVMCTNYNAGARSFDDKNSMMQYDASNSARTTESAAHGVECDPSKLSGAAGHYIRAKPKAGQDLKTYDHGTFQFATCGLPSSFANETLGELWVYYTVKLRKPRLFSGKSLNISRDLFLHNNAGNAASAASTGSMRWAGAVTNNIGCLITPARATDSNGNANPAAGSGGYYDIVFPASYSGHLEVRVMCCGTLNNTLSTGYTPESIDSVFGVDTTADSTASDPSSHLRKFHTTTCGEISAIEDMYGSKPKSAGMISAQPSESFKPRWFTATLAVSGSDSTDVSESFIAIAHVKVGIATGGVDNRLTMWLPDFFHGSAGPHKGQYAIDVAEYNTFDLGSGEPTPAYKLLGFDGRMSTTDSDPLSET